LGVTAIEVCSLDSAVLKLGLLASYFFFLKVIHFNGVQDKFLICLVPTTLAVAESAEPFDG